MAGTTDHYGLQTLAAGDDFSLNSYKYTNADRGTIDRVLYSGAVGHRHRGGAGITEAPTLAPSLDLDTSQGVIPASTRVYYKYTYVDEAGNETAASPEAFVETPQALQAPGAPTLSYTTTGGTLIAGNYFYVLTAYEDATTSETTGTSPNSITVPTGTTTNKVTLTLPTTPLGADGFNVYRKKPGGLGYFWIASVDMTVVTPPTTFVDTGYEDDCNRTLPTTNSTNMSNAVTVSLPGATPTVPEGFTWKVYRTYTSGEYTNSLLAHVVEETYEGSGVIDPTYLDLGPGTTTGEPPSSNYTYGDPSQINLTDGSEVQGTLPPAFVSGFPVQITLRADDAFTAGRKKDIWVCEFPAFEIKGVRASVSEVGTSTTIVVDLSVGTTPDTATSIFVNAAARPRISTFTYIGAVVTPSAGSTPAGNLTQGQCMVMDITSDGGGATPNHRNLRVDVFGWATFTSEDSDPDWE